MPTVPTVPTRPTMPSQSGRPAQPQQSDQPNRLAKYSWSSWTSWASYIWLSRLRRKPPLLNPAEAYTNWAASYPAETHTALMELEQKAVLGMLPKHIQGLACDLACGSGRYIPLLAARGAVQVIGLDFSSAMLARARCVSVSLVQADCLALPFAPASFSLIVCGLALGHVENLSQAILEIGRILTPGGCVVYSDFHPLGAWLGWQRTFQASDGRRYAVQHYPHLYADHHAACRAADLCIEDVQEPRIDFAHPWQGYPAALVIRAHKPG